MISCGSGAAAKAAEAQRMAARNRTRSGLRLGKLLAQQLLEPGLRTQDGLSSLGADRDAAHLDTHLALEELDVSPGIPGEILVAGYISDRLLPAREDLVHRLQAFHFPGGCRYL